jgi:divalent metal cation (Fe/Co/Zn/Cd) transporter
MHPNSISHLADGIWITTTAGFANYLLGTYLIKKGKKLNSIVLTADGKHLMSDAYTSLGLIVGLIIIKITGYILLDSILSILLGGLILHNGYQLLRHSVAGLMDEIDPKVVDQIVKILGDARKDTWVDVHNLRAQKYGADLHIDCHLTLPHYWHLNQMHDEVHSIELLMKEQAATQVELFIHVDPCLPQCCFYCAVPNCKERQTAQNSTIPWTKKNIMKNTKHFVD